MPRRSRGPNQREAEQRLQRNRYRISEARRTLVLSPLRTLLEAVRIQECDGVEGDPETAAVDPAAGVLWVNPHHRLRRGEASEADWTTVLGHLLLHLGLNHAARREDREPLV